MHACRRTGCHLVALEIDEAIFKAVLSSLAGVEAIHASPAKKRKATASSKS